MTPWLCGAALEENFGDLRFGFADLLRATDLPFVRAGERAPRGADRQEVVEQDATPFDAVGVEQDPAARTILFVQPQAIRQTR